MPAAAAARASSPRRWRATRVLALLLALAGFGTATTEAAWHAQEAAKMGTRIEVRLWHEDAAAAARLIEAAMAEIERIEAAMSTFRADSEISRVNARAAEAGVPVSAELFALVGRSIELSRLSGGAFDVTYDSVGQFYDYRAGRRPSEAEIEAHLAQIDYRHLRLDSAARSIAFAVPGTRINLGGIAKGHAVERVIALLRAAGVRHALASAGGDTRLLGDHAGRPWVIAVRDPDDPARVVTSLSLVDEAISTSGDYERYFDEGGERHHHILDPRTGKSARGVRSVTVVGPDAVMTEGLTKTVFIRGPQAGLALVESVGGYEAVVIDDHHRVFFSRGLLAAR
jgi:thiamine biosynthesis lipoprotein